MELFYIIDVWGNEQPLICKDLLEARSIVMNDYVNTGKRTILRKTYDIVCTETCVVDTDYEEDYND